MHGLLALAKKARYRPRGKIFYVCYGTHHNDAIYAENLLEFFREEGTPAEAIRLQPQNPQRELLRCLNDSTLGVLGLNVQLDHSWIDSDNFLDLAAAADIPVIHWFLDHASSRWREFTNANAQNSRFLFLSPLAERYFLQYALPGCLTACTVNTGQNHRSRIAQLTRDEFLSREIACLVPLNLRRISGSLADAMLRQQALDRKLARAVDRACEQAYYDLDGALERHLQNALADAGLAVNNSLFNDAFQIVEDVVQIRRRQRIFEIARAFPVLIQSDESAAPFASGGKARFETNVSMRTTFARMKSARAVLSVSRVNDELHNRIQNGVNAGCANIVEDNTVNRSVLTDGKNALLFNYRDDSLREHLEFVCSNPRRAYELAQTGFVLRDETPFRFGGFHNILELAQTPVPGVRHPELARQPSLAL
ncbi:MAG TPA: hypothetical protein VFL49_08085 [Pseudolabrys sp.]|nr:hypothetical protein [Pseudolabrys sp.]